MARGRWLKKMANKAKDHIEDVKELIDSVDGGDEKQGKNNSSSVMGNLLSSALSGDTASTFAALTSNVDLGPAVAAIQERGVNCHKVAAETMELCESTQQKSQQMVDFGSEIQKTLQGFGSTMDASALEMIRDLTDGAKLKQAMEIAKDMDVIALGCIDKSVQMIDIMEDAMDDLPDALEKWIDHAADQQTDEEEKNSDEMLSMKSLDKDIDDVKACIQAMSTLNIATAFEVGLQAFQQLSTKAQTSRAMFQSIQGFSTSVRDITEDFATLDIVSLASKVKDILKCIRLSEVMRAFAEGAKKIIQVLIDLFQATSDRISTLWAGLAFAKDCMADCVEHVVQAKTLVLDAHDKSRSLLGKSQSIMEQLQSVGKINRQTYQTVRDLGSGDEITEAIALAKGMDDLIIECTTKVNSMVDRVSEGFRNLPDIITDGFDLKEQGKDESDPEPVDVEEDIADLEASREAIEGSDILSACKSGVSGFKSVSTKTEVCTDMLVNVRDFATNCNGTIDSFLGVWDLNSAITKIQEMCRLVSLGELMKQFASQIKRLILAIIALLKSAMAKFSNLKLSDLTDQVDDVVGNAVGGVLGDEVGDLVGQKVDQAMDKLTGKFSNFLKR